MTQAQETEKNPHLTITLTGRRPVRITKDNWPILASARDSDQDDLHRPTREAVWKLVVRQHDDGRALVYGTYLFTSCWEGAKDHRVRGGELLDAASDIPEAIQRVAAELESRVPPKAYYGTGVFPRLAHECIADLPPVEM